MKTPTIIFFSLLLFFGCQEQETTSELSNAASPVAKKVNHTFTEFDNTRIDPYHWLTDPEDPEVIALLESENAHVENMLRHTKDVQEEVYEELVARIEKRYESLPTKRNGYWYYVRYDEDSEYPYYCRKKESLEAEEEIFLNVNQMAEGRDVYRLFSYFISPDNQKVAFLVDTSGDRRNTLFFKDLNSGKLLSDQISNCSYAGAWAEDNQTFFYTTNDKTVRSHKVMRHELGNPVQNDAEIYSEPDSTYTDWVTRSSDDKYIFIASGSTTSSEYWFLPADQPKTELSLIQEREKGLEYFVDSYYDDQFYIRHNRAAVNFMVSTSPINNPGVENWASFVPHQPGVLLNGFTVRKDYVILQERTEAVDKIHVINRQTGDEHYLDFGEEAYTANMFSPTDEFESDSIRYNYSSLTTPSSTFGYNLSSQEKKLLKQVKVGGGFNGDLYESKRVWVEARDGAQVPVSLVYRIDQFEQDGSNPCLLYSYGSYGASSMPNFNSNVFSLLDRGFVYAIAHIRGGQEMGREWYDDGKLFNKKNTFNDFVDCAQFLVDEKYTNTSGLFASGGSAGGMLMGAVTNMRPDLFKGIIAYVPWMDVITDMLNTDLPLTTLEYDEWGNPTQKDYYDYMLSWSPYDNVKEAEYPAIFATGGLNDTQVPYFSPAKWVQKVRENNTGDAPVLFKCDMGAGHGGKSGRFQRQEETALIYSFIIDQAGNRIKQ